MHEVIGETGGGGWMEGREAGGREQHQTANTK